MKHVCAICGAEYDETIITEWGIREDTLGYGPKPVCIAQLPEGYPQYLPGDVERTTHPHFTCGAELVPQATTSTRSRRS